MTLYCRQIHSCHVIYFRIKVKANQCLSATAYSLFYPPETVTVVIPDERQLPNFM